MFLFIFLPLLQDLLTPIAFWAPQNFIIMFQPFGHLWFWIIFLISSHFFFSYNYPSLAPYHQIMWSCLHTASSFSKVMKWYVLPSGCCRRVVPHSQLAAKHFIVVEIGVMDGDCRGNGGGVLFKFGKEIFK